MLRYIKEKWDLINDVIENTTHREKLLNQTSAGVSALSAIQAQCYKWWEEEKKFCFYFLLYTTHYNNRLFVV
jgi:hypothetical protein